MKLRHVFLESFSRIEHHPAIAHLPPDVRAQLDASRTRRMMRDRRYWADVIPYVIVYVCAFSLLTTLYLKRLIAWLWIMGLWFLVFGLQVIGSSFRRRALRRALSAELFKLHLRPSECLICGYSLEGIDSVACPECGQPLAAPPSAAPAPPTLAG